MTNRQRAHRARRAIAAYVGGNEWPNDPVTDIGDFLCDLQHLCQLEGWDLDEACDKAAFHYEAESRLDWDEEE